MLLNTILLEADPNQGGGGYSGMIMLVALIVIFYFFMIRPQNKRQKEIREQRAKLARGSKVYTQGGVFGTVAEVKELSFLIEVAPGVKIEVDKNCVFAAPEDKAEAKQ